MSAQKRRRDESSSLPKPKKAKLSKEDHPGKSGKEHHAARALATDDIDFPRGGGTTFTPLEVKAIRTEAAKEADRELFNDVQAGQKKLKRKRKPEGNAVSKPAQASKKTDTPRVEHLNYKRMNVGMKIFGQIVSIQPLALVVSLPNQLIGHVPITHVSTQLTSVLEAMEEDVEQPDSDEEDKSEESTSRAPDLSDIFRPGQYVRAVVSAVREHGSSDMGGIGKTRDEVVKASRRVELSLVPEKVNAGVHKSDLQPGFTLTAAVKSIEDHGYILELGIPDVAGFLSFKDAKNGPFEDGRKLPVGSLLDVSVTKMSGNGRTCQVRVDVGTFTSSSISEVSTLSSILPGMLVQSLVTSVKPEGLNLQILGFFEGTVDQFHLCPGPPEKSYKLGQKLKARVLYDIPSDPPRFALSLAEHVVALTARTVGGKEGNAGSASRLQEAYPLGTILDAVKVARVDPDRGLIVEAQAGVEGFIHISQVSDDHTPSLSTASGNWKAGTTHTARVTGWFPFDGLLQLSLRPSILAQEFMQVGDIPVGDIIKGTIKKLGESGLIVTISGHIDGIIWPNHYADIALKHPAKRFKIGAKIKCRVLAVDAEQKRLALTAKKSLLESNLPIISSFEDAKVGVVALGVVIKVSEKSLIVEFYNKIKAMVSAKEASETDNISLSDAFVTGKVVKVRIISASAQDSRIRASIRQALSTFKSPPTDISGIEVGQSVEGVVIEVHKDNAILTLSPTGARALISLNNLAKYRGTSLVELCSSLDPGEKLEDLVVMTRNPEKGFVIVAHKYKAKQQLPTKTALSIETLVVGQVVGGRVTRHTGHGAFVKLSSHLGGTLHPTDAADDYEAGVPFPSMDVVLKAMVIDIDRDKRSIALSTRTSRMFPEQSKTVADREIKTLDDLKKGDTVRGFVKSVAEHGLFVTLGRNVDARIQIKELFDEYVKDWKPRFSVNQVVKGRILNVDLEKKQVEMTFRSGKLAAASAGLSLSDLQEGQIVNGRVKKIEDYGLFIEIEGSKISGLCHKSQLSDDKDSDLALALRGFREGDSVKAMIRAIDMAKRRISFGLKPSYFFNDEEIREEPEESQSENSDSQPDDVDSGDMSDDADQPAAHDDDIKSIQDNEDEDEELCIDMDTQPHFFIPVSQNAPATTSGPSLNIQGGFRWSGDMGSSDEEDKKAETSSDESDDEQSGKKKKRRRKEIEQDLTAKMHTKTPDSNADFERLLLGSPSSSYLWVQYMSFQLQLSEIEKARDIGRRALETISFREEQEKLNVWIALLNLENIYGTAETLDKTFKDAARSNDSKTVHLRLANIFDQAEKHDKAKELFVRTCKKFGQSSKVWTLHGEYLLRRGELEDARKLLPQGLQSLDKRKHLKTISKFAQLEYKLGDPERGKTIFQGIVDSHAKRWDLWSVYIDMEATQGDIQSIRNLFDRVLAQKMTSHKAKAFFKKWLDLERRLGDEEGAARVKEKAIEWTQKAANSS